MPWGLIVILAFWGTAFKLWITDGAKVPLIFIAIWGLGLAAFSFLHWPSAAFLAFQAILAILLLLIDRYKSMV